MVPEPSTSITDAVVAYRDPVPVGKRRYPLLGGPASRSQWAARMTALGVGVAAVYLYRLYLMGSDVAPDSVPGLIFAVLGTALLLLVAVGYVVRKRLRRGGAARLHTALAWHAAGGILGVLLIFMHAAGNFNARSGTYALVALMAVVLSGMVGRLFDRVCPRLAAAAAARTMFPASGAGPGAPVDIVPLFGAPDRSRHASLVAAQQPGVPWDLAYYDLDPEVESIPSLLRPSVALPAGQTNSPRVKPRGGRPPHSQSVSRPARPVVASHSGYQGREAFFIQMVRVWRRLHALLSVVALGLLVWHIVFAATLFHNAH